MTLIIRQTGIRNRAPVNNIAKKKKKFFSPFRDIDSAFSIYLIYIVFFERERENLNNFLKIYKIDQSKKTHHTRKHRGKKNHRVNKPTIISNGLKKKKKFKQPGNGRWRRRRRKKIKNPELKYY